MGKRTGGGKKGKSLWVEIKDRLLGQERTANIASAGFLGPKLAGSRGRAVSELQWESWESYSLLNVFLQ